MCRRSLVTAHRGYVTVATVLILPIPLVVVRLISDVRPETYRSGVYTTILTLMLFCFLTTSFAYFKVYQIIRHHQQRTQEHETSPEFWSTNNRSGKIQETCRVDFLHSIMIFCLFLAIRCVHWNFSLSWGRVQR